MTEKKAWFKFKRLKSFGVIWWPASWQGFALLFGAIAAYFMSIPALLILLGPDHPMRVAFPAFGILIAAFIMGIRRAQRVP
jgi:hypothetical protein